MKAIFLSLFVTTLSALAAETNTDSSATTNLAFTVDGVKYEHARLEKINPTTVKVRHSSGIDVLPMTKLPPDVQAKIGYDPNAAAKWKEQLEQTRLAQQAAKASEEDAKKEAWIKEHTYTVKYLEGAFNSIPDKREIIVKGFLFGSLGSGSGHTEGMSYFTINGGDLGGYVHAYCKTDGEVFSQLVESKPYTGFQFFGVKVVSWDGYGFVHHDIVITGVTPTGDKLTPKVIRVKPVE